MNKIMNQFFKRTKKYLLVFIAMTMGLSASAETRKEKIANSKMFTDKESGVSPAWNLSAGLILGTPTGFVIKDEFSVDQAVDFGLSYSFNKMFVFYGDWEYRFPAAFKSMGASGEFSRIEAYAGVGAALLISSSDTAKNQIRKEDAGSSLGILFRIPVGVQYRLAGKPLVFFVELVPGIGIIPGTFGYFGAGLGARYYF